MARPRIIFVTAVPPAPAYGGERIHVAQLIRDLAELSELTVLGPPLPPSSGFAPAVAGWQVLPGLPRGFRAHLTDALQLLQPQPERAQLLRTLIGSTRAEIVWFNYGHWGQYAAVARDAGALTVMQTHNAQAQLTRQGLLQPPLNRWQAVTAVRSLFEALHERRLFPAFDHILSVSPADQAYHARFVGPKRSHLLPNYIDEAGYRSDGARIAGRVLMTANFHAFQNQRGADWLLTQVWPAVRAAVPQAELQLAGVAPPRWQRQLNGSADVLGAVDSMVPLLGQAAVAVVPLQHGSGTRFKILEALAAGTPLVSTTLGAAGIPLLDGVHARLADRPADFAAAVIDCLQRPDAAAVRADAGRRLLIDEFGRAVNRERITTLLTHILTTGPRS
jgi:glycosyltransferase involved in cell wall biosynthesis